jgi:transcriptional regulator with XRE-family HTH domain
MSEYGETLARFRDEAGLSQRDLGAAIGLDPTQVNKIEHGHRPPLRAKYMKPLVRALRLERSQAEKLVDLARLSRKVLDFMVEEDEAEEEERRPISTAPSTTANSLVELPARFVGAKAEEVERLIASGGYSEEEEEDVWGAVIEMIKRFNSFKESQRRRERKSR